MVKNADFAGIGKSMMAVLDGHARLKDEEMMIGAKLADAIDKSATKSSQLAQFLSIQDLKSMSLPELATFLSQTLAETGGPNAEGLAKALALQAVLSNSNSDPIKLAKSLRVTNGLVKAGVPKSTVSRLLHEALEDNPGARKKAIEDVKKPLKDLTELIANPANNFILFYKSISRP
jgi:hypothetical protein